MPLKKIAVSKLDELCRGMDETEPPADFEVTWPRAIERMAPSIRAMRTKGFGWPDIAAWLRERGFDITTGLLRGYFAKADAQDDAGSSEPDRPAARRGANCATSRPAFARCGSGCCGAGRVDGCSSHCSPAPACGGVSSCGQRSPG